MHTVHIDAMGEYHHVRTRYEKILIEDVQRLTFSQQKKLHEYARAMMVSRPSGSKGSELLRFSGFFDKKSVREMMIAIRDCEKVDNGEW